MELVLDIIGGPCVIVIGAFPPAERTHFLALILVADWRDPVDVGHVDNRVAVYWMVCLLQHSLVLAIIDRSGCPDTGLRPKYVLTAFLDLESPWQRAVSF